MPQPSLTHCSVSLLCRLAARRRLAEPFFGWPFFTRLALHSLVNFGYAEPSYDWDRGRLVVEITTLGAARAADEARHLQTRLA